MNRLKDILNKKKIIKVMEAHSGISALIVEKSKYSAIWISSLTHSASKGLPDIELVSLNERIDLVKEIRRVVQKPIIVDIDTGGDIRHLPYYVKWFEQAGADAIVIEDKKYPKENSLDNKSHSLEDVDKFAKKIKVSKKASKDILIIARLESLIAKRSVYDALLRASAFQEAGADAMLIHSKSEISADEVMEFAKKFRERSCIPLVAIPTSYILPEKHLFNIVIYANQMFRSSIYAMEQTIKAMEDNKKVEMSSVRDIFNLIGQ